MKTKTIPCHVCHGRGYISKCSENGSWSESCEYCHGTGTEEVPITNADRIRAMSDEELASFLAAKFTDLHSKQYFGEISPPTATQLSEMGRAWFTAWMQWFQQPAEEGAK